MLLLESLNLVITSRHWGVYDVEDTIAGAESLHLNGFEDPQTHERYQISSRWGSSSSSSSHFSPERLSLFHSFRNHGTECWWVHHVEYLEPSSNEVPSW